MDAPAPPPLPVIFPQPARIARQPPNYKRLHKGDGSTTVGNVDYLVQEDAALMEICITIKVNAGNPFVVRLNSALIPNRQGSPRDWLVHPPQMIAPNHACWYAFRGALPVFQNLGVQMTNAVALPNAVDVVMKLGDHKFGLIHLLAGHHDNARLLAATKGTKIDGVMVTNVMNTNDADDDSYRTVMGVQMLVSQLFAPSAILQINWVAVDRKWLFLGETNGKLAVMVVQVNAGIAGVTTVYLTQSPSLEGDVAWKRRKK